MNLYFFTTVYDEYFIIDPYYLNDKFFEMIFLLYLSGLFALVCCFRNRETYKIFAISLFVTDIAASEGAIKAINTISVR